MKDSVPSIPSSEITSESSYLSRRNLLKAAGIGAAAVASPITLADEKSSLAKPLSYKTATAVDAKKGYYVAEALTPFDDVTRYNNFYEFGTGKDDPARLAPKYLKTDPWNIRVTGEAKKTGEFHLEDWLGRFDLQERIYRFRCVEAWSMVIPWVGFPLAELIKWLEPTSKAKYIGFETLVDPKQMPAQASITSTIDWPYVEGLRMDEAMNDLTLMSVGLYGKTLLPQSGAPFRLVVPWKYGFKSIKSIVSIHFLERQPPTTWQQLAPHEYGFYANVNPTVNHPRWSQASERRLPSGLFDFRRKETLMFNGYGEQVASLYAGMDLRKHY